MNLFCFGQADSKIWNSARVYHETPRRICNLQYNLKQKQAAHSRKLFQPLPRKTKIIMFQTINQTKEEKQNYKACLFLPIKHASKTMGRTHVGNFVFLKSHFEPEVLEGRGGGVKTRNEKVSKFCQQKTRTTNCHLFMHVPYLTLLIWRDFHIILSLSNCHS